MNGIAPVDRLRCKSDQWERMPRCSIIEAEVYWFEPERLLGSVVSCFSEIFVELLLNNCTHSIPELGSL